MVIKVSILAHLKQSLKIIIKTDSSNYINSGFFFQLGKEKLLYPVIFFFKNLNPAKYNYKIDKKLSTIIQCFEQWKPELEAIRILIKVIIDHKSLKYFMTTKKLLRQQICWAKFFLGFNFVISYI